MNQPHESYILITGASKGIGRACALRLDQMGARVFAGVRSDADGDALREEASDRLTPVILDIVKPDTIAAVRRQVFSETGGRIAGLVNNAGVPLASPLEFLDLDAFRQMMDVNVFGLVAVTQAFLPALRGGIGRVVNISSVSGRVAMPYIGPYTASKHAVEALSDSLRVELRPWKIHVALIEPAAVATPIWENTASRVGSLVAAMPPEAHELYGSALRLMTNVSPHGIPPEQVARAVTHALFARWPRARYPVGPGASLVHLLGLLPAPVRDWGIALALKLRLRNT